MQTDALLVTYTVYCQVNFVAALLNFVGTLPAEPFFCLFNFCVFQKGME